MHELQHHASCREGAKLAEVELLMGYAGLPSSGQLAPAQTTRSKRWATEAAGAPSKKQAKSVKLSSKVDLLTAELAQMKSLLLALHSSAGTEDAGTPTPPMAESFSEEDAVSMAASATLFNEYNVEEPSHASGLGSRSSAHISSDGMGDSSMGAIIRMALARLQLDIWQPESAPANAFFRRAPPSTTFTVPPSEEYLRELQTCWRDTRAFSRLPSDGRTLAAMQDAAKFGLDHMPAIEPAIASLIVSPDEALRPEAWCPRPQCRVTDDLLSKAYDTATPSLTSCLPSQPLCRRLLPTFPPPASVTSDPAVSRRLADLCAIFRRPGKWPSFSLTWPS